MSNMDSSSCRRNYKPAVLIQTTNEKVDIFNLALFLESENERDDIL